MILQMFIFPHIPQVLLYCELYKCNCTNVKSNKIPSDFYSSCMDMTDKSMYLYSGKKNNVINNIHQQHIQISLFFANHKWNKAYTPPMWDQINPMRSTPYYQFITQGQKGQLCWSYIIFNENSIR